MRARRNEPPPGRRHPGVDVESAPRSAGKQGTDPGPLTPVLTPELELVDPDLAADLTLVHIDVDEPRGSDPGPIHHRDERELVGD